MSNSCPPPPPQPLTAPLARSQTTCARADVPPQLSRSVSCPVEFALTPTCPPPPSTPPTNCCAQFPEPPPSPPALRRTDTSADYAVVSSRTTADPMYDRWLIEDNFARLSVMEQKLMKQMSDLGMIRESLYQINKRLNDGPPPPSSPVTRQVASPNAAPAAAPASPPALDMARDFGM